jgi:hypothetical protein
MVSGHEHDKQQFAGYSNYSGSRLEGFHLSYDEVFGSGKYRPWSLSVEGTGQGQDSETTWTAMAGVRYMTRGLADDHCDVSLRGLVGGSWTTDKSAPDPNANGFVWGGGVALAVMFAKPDNKYVREGHKYYTLPGIQVEFDMLKDEAQGKWRKRILVGLVLRQFTKKETP